MYNGYQLHLVFILILFYDIPNPEKGSVHLDTYILEPCKICLLFYRLIDCL